MTSQKKRVQSWLKMTVLVSRFYPSPSVKSFA